MKKILVAIFAVLYISTSTGATIHLHYCMGKLVKWGLWHDTSKKCGKCGMEKDKENGCCSDEQKQLKIGKDQKAAYPAFQMMQLLSVVLPASFVANSSYSPVSVTEVDPLSHAPPRTSGVAVYIRNCLYLI